MKNNFRAYMLDIETLAKTNNAVVTEIAVVEFGYFHETMGFQHYLPEYYQFDSWHDELPVSEQMHRDVSIQTMEWRRAQGMPEPVQHTDQSLTKILEPYALLPPGLWFCQGIDFDLNIFESLLNEAGLSAPWYYWAKIDLRTLTSVGLTQRHNNVTTHNALQDCYDQIETVLTMPQSGWTYLWGEIQSRLNESS